MQIAYQQHQTETRAKRPAFRFIWLGALVSLLGDWFTLIALYSLLQEYTGRGEAIGLFHVTC